MRHRQILTAYVALVILSTSLLSTRCAGPLSAMSGGSRRNMNCHEVIPIGNGFQLCKTHHLVNGRAVPEYRLCDSNLDYVRMDIGDEFHGIRLVGYSAATPESVPVVLFEHFRDDGLETAAIILPRSSESTEIEFTAMLPDRDYTALCD